MSAFIYSPPGRFNKSVYGCNIPHENFRLKSLLLLIGIGKIGKNGARTQKNLAHDFMLIPYQTSGSCTISTIESKFPNYSRKELDAFFRSATSKNTPLHIGICSEIKNAIGHHSESNQIACFVHIYRAIEQIALCLPVVSIINKGTFNNTFSELKVLFDGGAKTDLAVLKKYSNNHLNRAVADSVARISFSRTTRPIQNINVIKRFFKNSDIVSETPDTIEIKYKNLDTLIIGFRNQFFHYLFHERNLSMGDIEYPEEFLEVCNPIFLNYLAFLFHELIDSELTLWG